MSVREEKRDEDLKREKNWVCVYIWAIGFVFVPFVSAFQVKICDSNKSKRICLYLIWGHH